MLAATSFSLSISKKIFILPLLLNYILLGVELWVHNYFFSQHFETIIPFFFCPLLLLMRNILSTCLYHLDKLIFLYSSFYIFSFILHFLKLLYYVPLYGSIMLLLFYCYYSACYSKCTDNLNTFVSLQCQKILSEYQIFFSCQYLYYLYARTCFQRH